MAWGILFRREISLTYARIQDIHLSSNFVERWLGLARIQVQTASGSTSAEMTIEGLQDFEEVRDFLYSRMRGVKDTPRSVSPVAEEGAYDPHPRMLGAEAAEDLTGALRAVTAEIRALRVDLERRASTDEHAHE